MTLLLNIFDYAILMKYYNTFLGERRHSSRLFFGVYSLFIILFGMITNLLGNKYFNLLVACIVLILTGFWFRGRAIIKICYFFVYLGIWTISEVFTILIVGNMTLEQNNLDLSFAMAICQGIKYSIILIFRTFKTEQNENLPRGTTIIIAAIFMGASLGCLLINWNSLNKNNTINLISTWIIVATFLLIFFLIFVLLDRFNRASRLYNEQSLMIQEHYLKESYYKEIDANNLQLRKIKHDFKNKLLALSNLTDKDVEAVRETLNSMFEELNKLEGKIYTENNAINAICKVKFTKAMEKKIRFDYYISIPDCINIDYGDLGILYGNLMDNAIDSCEMIEESLRYIYMKTELFNENLLVFIENSKASNVCLVEPYITTKKDKQNHGFGLKSVREVVEKYNGMMNIDSNLKTFKVEIVLYGIVNKK